MTLKSAVAALVVTIATIGSVFGATDPAVAATDILVVANLK